MQFANVSFDWKKIDLVVFDVDGTLYNQTKLRAFLLSLLLRDAARRRSLDTLLTLRAFRRVREQLATGTADNFLEAQYTIPAAQCGQSVPHVRAIVAEWIEQKPLPYLQRCRWPGVAELFEAVKGAGKTIGVLSDYPVSEKLAALELRADFAVCSSDPDVARLKPHPAGLCKLLRMAAIEPRRAILIGDRIERDGAAAARINMRALIRSRGRHRNALCFSSFSDSIFEPLFSAAAELQPDDAPSHRRAVPV